MGGPRGGQGRARTAQAGRAGHGGVGGVAKRARVMAGLLMRPGTRLQLADQVAVDQVQQLQPGHDLEQLADQVQPGRRRSPPGREHKQGHKHKHRILAELDVDQVRGRDRAQLQQLVDQVSR